MKDFGTSGHLVYVVDDELSIRKLVSMNLLAAGYQVKEFTTGLDALTSLKGDDPNLIILDVVMPGPNGLEVVRKIRQSSRVPILMLTVRHEIPTKLAALELGADDYLIKPFQIEELQARVRAILRRTAPDTFGSPDTVYHSGNLTIDFENMRVTTHKGPVQLTPREWAMLRVLVKHRNRVASPRQILREAWGPGYGDEGDYVRTYIARLRSKLEPDPQHPRHILLDRGLGYRLADPTP